MIARFILAAGLATLSAAGAFAQQITVRSGEHGDFSRLVIPFPQGTRWDINQTAEGITLTPVGSGFLYDLTEIFRFIPKTRITAVRTEVGKPGLFLETAGLVHPDAFQLANGALVLDVIDGPPKNALSPFAQATETPTGSADAQQLNLYWKNKASQAATEATHGQNPIALTVPNSRVSEAERKLLESLSRATAQGLFTVDMLRNGTRNGKAAAAPAGAEPLAPEDDELAIRSQTVIDRDLDLDETQPRILLTGQRCLPDRLFDLQGWLTDAAPADQISAARAALVGEFDRPDDASALKLARVYLALGFGAEAKSVLRSFNQNSRTAQAYAYVADVLDETIPAQDSPINGMAGCDGKAALWALAGNQTPPPIDQIDLTAVQAAFSALPADARNIVGPNLVDKLLSIGARDAAQAVRNALGRSPDPRGASLAIAQAHLDMASGDPAAAEKRLTPIARSNDGAAARALVMAIDARLERNRPVDRESVENAAALAHELGASEEGSLLRRATVLGEGSVGEFDQAFLALDAWPLGAQKTLQIQARKELYAQLAKVPDDSIFLSQIIRRETDALQANLPASLQIELSNRLTDAGFARAAKAIIDATAKGTPAGRLALARAALAEPDPAAAVSHLEGLDGEKSNEIRAQALARLGEHSMAAQIFAENGDNAAAGKEAWRAGDWRLVAQYGSDVQKRAANTLVLTSQQQANPEGPPPGLLARSNALLDQSRDERQAIDALLSQ